MNFRKLTRDVSLFLGGGGFFVTAMCMANEENNTYFNNVLAFSLSAIALISYASTCNFDKYGLFSKKEDKDIEKQIISNDKNDLNNNQKH